MEQRAALGSAGLLPQRRELLELEDLLGIDGVRVADELFDPGDR